MNKIGPVAVAAALMALLALPAIAASPRDMKDCDQPGNASPDRTIAVCARALVGADPKSAAHYLNSRGIAFNHKQQYDRAIADFDEGIRLDPTYGRLYVSRSLSWKGKKQFDRAMADLDDAVRVEPDLVAALINRGNLLSERGELDRAIADFGEAIRLNPQAADAYNGRGIAWDEKGEFDQAIADFSEAIRVYPQDSKYINNRGDAWEKKGDYDRAIADFSEAIRMSPHWGIPRANRGLVYRLKGDLVRALADQNISINGVPGTIADPNKGTFVYIQRGDTLRYLGEFKRAIADYQHALRNGPGYVPALTGLGFTYEKMGDLAAARSWFQQALASQDPDRFVNVSRSATEAARARLAALDSGIAQPSIPNALPQAASATSIPTPAVAAPSVPPAEVKAAVSQGRRIALVIGNSDYKNVGFLNNPEKDAAAIAASLRNIGFDRVIVANNATREKLIDQLRAFADEAEKADWAMVYYAGHGLEAGGVNYLIPTDAKLATDRDIQFEAVPLDQVMAAVEAARKLKLVVLDACRDNPFSPRRTAAPEAVAAASAPTAGAKIGSRSIGRGLAEVNVASGTLVVFAAKNGQVALDGDGDNSPFAVAVLQRIATPGVEINKLFRLVRDDVMEATAGRQEPYTYGSLPGKEDFFFVEK